MLLAGGSLSVSDGSFLQSATPACPSASTYAFLYPGFLLQTVGGYSSGRLWLLVYPFCSRIRLCTDRIPPRTLPERRAPRGNPVCRGNHCRSDCLQHQPISDNIHNPIIYCRRVLAAVFGCDALSRNVLNHGFVYTGQMRAVHTPHLLFRSFLL